MPELKFKGLGHSKTAKVLRLLKKFYGRGAMQYFERRMCTFTKRPIDAKDRLSVQLVLAKLDGLTGQTTGEVDIVDISGCIRKTGEVDALLLEHARNN